MKRNQSNEHRIEHLLNCIVASQPLHMLWLNTLSYLENCGARKIALSEHPTAVHCEMLKHAAEEFRHAYYLKKQMNKIGAPFLETYTLNHLLGGFNSLHYLDKLEIRICRLLKNKFPELPVKNSAYLLITYAIEVRASLLYPAYQSILIKHRSSVSMRSIIAEEDHHLADISRELSKLLNSNELKLMVCSLENSLFQDLIDNLETCISNEGFEISTTF